MATFIFVPHLFSGSSEVKASVCNVGDLGSIPGLERSPGERKGYPLQYSGLENSMDCIVHGVTKSQTQLSDFHFHSSLLTFGAVSLFNCSNLGWCVGNLTFLLIPVY